MPRRRLGEILIEAGVVDAKDVTAALREQLRWGGPLGRILIDMNVISEDALVSALSQQLECRAVDLDKWEIPRDILDLVPGEVAERHMVIPFNASGNRLDLAMSDPTQQGVIDEVHIRSHLEVAPHIAGPKAMERALARYYSRGAGMLDLTLGRAGGVLLETSDSDELSDASGLIVPDEKTRATAAEGRARRDSGNLRDSVITGPPPIRVPDSIPPVREPSSVRDSAPVFAPTPVREHDEVEELRTMLRQVRDELRATQQRVAVLESLLNRDEDVLRKLLLLLIEKRVATRDEILSRIK